MNQAGHLCLECGLCCNGALFADLKLRPQDDTRRLSALGLPFKSRPAARAGGSASAGKVAQPCLMFDGRGCRIYADRPLHCRHFECLLLRDANAGTATFEQALRRVRTAKAGVREVQRLLRALADTEEHLPLRTRFRRTTRLLERTGADQREAALCSELTLAMHRLDVLLSEAFYR